MNAPQMTPSQILALSPEEKRVKIAEYCPPTAGLSACRNCWNWIDLTCCSCGSAISEHNMYDNHPVIPYGCRCGYATQPQPESVPDYLNDLNAIHEAEKRMHDAEDGAPWNEYVRHLNRICAASGDEDIHATASQRSDAFLLTILSRP